MAIIINTQSTLLPITIGELQFQFDTADDALKKLVAAGEEFEKALEAARQGDDVTLQDILKKGFDMVLGDGAFEQIYEQTSSTVRVMEIFAQLSQHLSEELSMANILGQQNQAQKAQQYVRNKKQKKSRNKR